MINKIKNIKNIFVRDPEHLIGIKQEANSKKFALLYGKNEIGYLKYLNHEWIFVYSNWFKKQNTLLPLVEFPNKTEIYKSKELWSFFKSRIPSMKQPKLIKMNGKMNAPNLAVLLEMFGKQTVNNPFILEIK